MSNDNISSLLPLEILNKIFDYLNYHNKKSYLYNCALVCRTWCLLSIPIIWSKPFNCKKISRIGYENNDKFNNIIGIYTNLLDENTKLQLNLFNCTDRLLFNYCEYMKEFDYLELYNAVLNWTVNKILINEMKKKISISKVEIYEKSYYLSYELLKLFIQKCINLFYISLDSTKFENIYIPQKSMLFENCFKFDNSLISIKTIRIGEIHNKENFVKFLSKQCYSIKEIFIKLSDKDSKCKIGKLLEGLIIKQKFLKNFHCNSSINFPLNATRIIKALFNNDNNHLSYVEFSQCLFDNEINLFKFSCLSNFKFVLIECKVFNNESNNFDYLDENFITNYFNYIPEIVDFNFDEDKKSNTIVVTTRLS